MSIEDFNLRRFPLSLSDPNVLVKQLLNFSQDIEFLSGLLVIGSFNLFLKIVNSIVNVFKILQYKLGVDNFHISDWINWVLSMCDVFIFEWSYNVINTVDFFDVAQEMVTQTFTLWCTSDQSSNINNLQDCWYLWFGFPNLTEFVKSLIWNWYNGLVWLNGTERIVFCWNIQFR